MRVLPKLQIAHLPTLVESLPRLSAVLGGPRILIKRDDQTGLAFGGNKTRKLEYLVAEAKASGAGTLITAGAMQSNHCRQTAAAAARFGFDCTLVLEETQPASNQTRVGKTDEGTPPGEQEQPSGNFYLDQIFGAEIVWAAQGERQAVLQQTYQQAEQAGRRPYLIPYGGSNPSGATAYVMALKELMAQCLQAPFDGKSPDWIVFPSASGGTQAGLVLGARIFGWTGHILGISVDEPELVLKTRVAELASQTAAYLEERVQFLPEEILVNADYLGGGYGVPGEAEREAIRMFARLEGILLDPVYSGRAAAGMLDLVRKGFFKPEENVLFWHTGGTPALFADRYKNLL